MYYKLSEKEQEIVKKISKITFEDYEVLGDFIPVTSLFSMAEDMLYEYDNLEEKYNDLEQDLENNYKPLSPAELYDITDKDFY